MIISMLPSIFQLESVMSSEGMQIGHYRLIHLIGSGGMGEVYLAQDMRISRNVAIKVVRSEAAPYPQTGGMKDANRLFEREMKAITALDHPNILPLYDFGEEKTTQGILVYMVMPYRSEGSLVDWLHSQKEMRTLSSLECLLIAINIGQQTLVTAQTTEVIINTLML
jgi:eukaryotic-like serine/threonine-protein kinase